MRKLAISCLCFAACAAAQGADSGPRFEVASIKPNTTTNHSSFTNYPPGGRLEGTNVSVKMLIALAYDIRDYQILNAPDWTATEHYDILAKPSAQDAAAEPAVDSVNPNANLRLRTRALLAERFGLSVHNETREMPIYALRLAKAGPKLQEASKTEIGPQMRWNNRQAICKKVTMKRFAEVLLSTRMERPVIDETGLTGEYDFEMNFVPDAADTTGPDFQTALQDQLGLKLVGTKGPGNYLIIDAVSKPTAN